MDFDSPDVMKDFPGLYASELNKKGNNNTDYSDDGEKFGKKDLVGKKKDKKDKEKGYAALEGESSADEKSTSRSPSKSKKAKTFKFTTKSKEKREKSREKETVDKKKDRDKKVDKKAEKEKTKSEKGKKAKSGDEVLGIADALPIFGVSLEAAVERSKCHDGVNIPLPVRECIDNINTYGVTFENVYKVSGTKSKVLQLRKMYNNRENVNLYDYDIPTCTSLLKMFLRDLPEPIFTNDLVVRFEEAGAILNVNTREKHLKILVDNLPDLNKLLLSWILKHLENICVNEKMNKMNRNGISVALSHTLHVSARLINALLYHCSSIFPQSDLVTYVPPLTSTSHLPDHPEGIELELRKQESLLNQIHHEMNVASISKQREELLWEVQRIITQLKRKLKTATKDTHKIEESSVDSDHTVQPDPVDPPPVDLVADSNSVSSSAPSESKVNEAPLEPETPPEVTEIVEEITTEKINTPPLSFNLDNAIMLLKFKNNHLVKLKDVLNKNIDQQKLEIESLNSQLQAKGSQTLPQVLQSSDNIDEIMSLLHKENQILEIKKINLVRQIIEQQESCINLKARLELYDRSS